MNRINIQYNIYIYIIYMYNIFRHIVCSYYLVLAPKAVQSMVLPNLSEADMLAIATAPKQSSALRAPEVDCGENPQKRDNSKRKRNAKKKTQIPWRHIAHPHPLEIRIFLEIFAFFFAFCLRFLCVDLLHFICVPQWQRFLLQCPRRDSFVSC